ncbi:proline--tRNA ligase [Candidatus Nitrotoga fabula]|uniref:Proline--tRNA ligase n=1 Tax=Candidatus Nitrotoga fabula TaxID=2182327 RepID=A0A916BFF0_9PROT|nr:proline--tRNA ligase [Candidatus Nitrotoga fabula]CAE6735263.1 proline--tRNA ligase [Candidatus Nitrotoga fabula]
MRISKFFISTQKEAPSEAELISHRLMLRAGYIKKLASGLYTWMPLGLRVLRKVETVVREEMNKGGGIEVLMPAIQPAELWQETGRWEVFGPQMLKIRDRHDNEFCFGPTHEEVITDIARREINSYRQLPVNFYQIQTKFRDEVRPRFGVMRAREFVMKDAYSFHADFDSLKQTYEVMYDTYTRIFTRMGLQFRAVAADTGAIGGSNSHEFHVLADSGEDGLAYCPTSDYAANVELAEAIPSSMVRAPTGETMQKIITPGQKSIEEICTFLNVSPQQVLKTIAVLDAENNFILILLRGDHMLNEIKAAKIIGEFRFASDDEIHRYMGCRTGYIGPVNAAVRILADRSAATMSNFVCGANDDGFHYISVNAGRDFNLEESNVHDLRNVVAGDPSPDGKGILELCRGIEVGHIFQLRTNYSEALNATFLDEQGKSQFFEMGCYGIGISRIVAAAIEQNYDEKGITLPAAIAPFQVGILPIGMNKSETVKTATEQLYKNLDAADIEVLLDDRNERPGVMFADLDLIGVPHRVVIGDRGLAQDVPMVEYKGRWDLEAQFIPLKDILSFLRSKTTHITSLP